MNEKTVNRKGKDRNQENIRKRLKILN